MIVEFIGCTNSGKSTIASRVAEKLKNLGFTVILVDVGGDIRMDFITLPRFVYFAIHNFTFCRFVVRIIAREVDSLVIGLNVFRNFAKKMGMYELLKKKNNEEIILWDEGTLHAAHNLFVHVNSPPGLADVRRFACFVSKPDMIVYVKTSSETAVERSFKRGHRRVKHTLKDVKLFVEHAYKTFEVLTSIAGIQDRLIVVNNFVSGTQEIENMADIVVKRIMAQNTNAISVAYRECMAHENGRKE